MSVLAAAALVVASASTAWPQQEKPEQREAAPATQPATDEMSMEAMMKRCMRHMQQCRMHIDEAAQAEDAGRHEETKKHLAEAKQQMDQCMQMMQMMQMMHGGMMGGEEHGMWTCPMHPQVQAGQPGTCPMCPAELVQAKPGAEGARDSSDDRR